MAYPGGNLSPAQVWPKSEAFSLGDLADKSLRRPQNPINTHMLALRNDFPRGNKDFFNGLPWNATKTSPSAAQERLKSSQERPKTGQEADKEQPRAAQEQPKAIQEQPRAAICVSKLKLCWPCEAIFRSKITHFDPRI